MGTPDFAVPTLDALVHAGHDLAAVYTQPPRRAGRGKAPRPSAVHARAQALGLPVRTPLSLKEAEEQAAFAAIDAQVAIVAAYGLILPRAILAAPVMGCLNVHASLLPRWRGAAPIQRAILAGDAETGVTIMQMASGLDTGAMLATARTPIERKTAGELTHELARAGAALMLDVLADPEAHVPTAQTDADATYAAKTNKAEARLDFAAGAHQAERQVRAFNPAPGAWISHGGERLKILAAQIEPGEGEPGVLLDDALRIGCGAGGTLRPTLVQRAGKGAMSPAELLRGFALPAGTRFDA